jgi:hypothetical protein
LDFEIWRIYLESFKNGAREFGIPELWDERMERIIDILLKKK